MRIIREYYLALRREGIDKIYFILSQSGFPHLIAYDDPEYEDGALIFSGRFVNLFSEPKRFYRGLMLGYATAKHYHNIKTHSITSTFSPAFIDLSDAFIDRRKGLQTLSLSEEIDSDMMHSFVLYFGGRNDTFGLLLSDTGIAYAFGFFRNTGNPHDLRPSFLFTLENSYLYIFYMTLLSMSAIALEEEIPVILYDTDRKLVCTDMSMLYMPN